MDLFQILILLFILYPLLQKLFGGGKKPADNRRADQSTTVDRGQGYQREPSRSAGTESWEDALRELESIFTGETTRRPPAPEPVQQPESTPFNRSGKSVDKSVDQSGRPAVAESPQLRRQRELQERYEKTRKSGSLLDEIADEDNPIFQSIDGGAVVEDEDRDYSEDTRKYLGLDDTRELQRHIILKEILDKPLSKREQGYRPPY
ncbi:MAG: hypothetical protein ACNA8K_07560 [Cyclonatronaceae bacterium]